jgi:hypothetical protein
VWVGNAGRGAFGQQRRSNGPYRAGCGAEASLAKSAPKGLFARSWGSFALGAPSPSDDSKSYYTICLQICQARKGPMIENKGIIGTGAGESSGRVLASR